MLETALLSAIASPRRREILRLVWSNELAAGAIHASLPDVTFGAISLQLRTLSEAGLVTTRREGRHRFYRARQESLGPVAAFSSVRGTTRCGSSSSAASSKKLGAVLAPETARAGLRGGGRAPPSIPGQEARFTSVTRAAEPKSSARCSSFPLPNALPSATATPRRRDPGLAFPQQGTQGCGIVLV
jgi:DNA-binding transcriptional ArsR family regulator